MKTLQYNILIYAFVGCFLSSCSKFLDVNPNTGEQISVRNFVDFEEVLNSRDFASHNMIIAEFLTDNIYFHPDSVARMPSDYSLRNAYLWNESIWNNNDTDELYRALYKNIAQANLVINYLDFALDGTAEGKRRLIAKAKIHRAYANFMLVNLYGPQFNAASAESDLAVPLITILDANQLPPRATVKQLYDLIERDLQDAMATAELPDKGNDVLHPGKVCAYALSAKVHLQKGAYEQAMDYANKALAINSFLIDYNPFLMEYESYVFLLFQMEGYQEVIFAKAGQELNFFQTTGLNIYMPEDLLSIYTENDLRLFAHYGQNYDTWEYIYPIVAAPDGSSSAVRFNNAITVPEMMLIAAECNARDGKVEEAMALINKLRFKRMLEDTHEDLEAASPEEALKHVLDERRRELSFKGGIRLMDIKRLANDAVNRTVLNRFDGEGNIMKSIEPNSRQLIIPLTPRALVFNPNLRD